MLPIKVKNLSKSFDSKRALDGISFSISDPGIVGIIGPNGAGKTTLIRILTGLLKPDSGRVELFGREPEKARELFALLPQDVRAHFYTLTPREYVYHYLRMRGLPKREAIKKAYETMEAFGIDYADELFSTLSGGMVRRALLAMVLSAEVPLYFLDEPTVGLDVQNRLRLWEILRERAEEATIILTSHYLNEISSVCDRVLLLKAGNIVADGRPEEIARDYLSGFTSKIVAFEGVSLGGFFLRRAGRNTYIYARSKAEEREIIERLEELGIPFRREEVTIEDVFLVGGLDDSAD
ncbi:daunorubicin ABC transporter ATP-binding protein [Thermococcus litoralis DSM 5473]|uniref:Daunorubicin ABC transporter ATP-binding protein n=1 Tax=Thermococcus litoralis (strain ATCC 51850 / DSM 5473 / JCM 8560 / NS-C) TaxID=523849 RepID=H3ZRJ2_THELN|nr:ABC transporter ATP-binding protein [Thermococcus litoralis]EHR77398.1 daunorubicin ABC transporter ATP-binding protein [Thermococcus litoralis DSM 5473]